MVQGSPISRTGSVCPAGPPPCSEGKRKSEKRIRVNRPNDLDVRAQGGTSEIESSGAMLLHAKAQPSDPTVTHEALAKHRAQVSAPTTKGRRQQVTLPSRSSASTPRDRQATSGRPGRTRRSAPDAGVWVGRDTETPEPGWALTLALRRQRSLCGDSGSGRTRRGARRCWPLSRAELKATWSLRGLPAESPRHRLLPAGPVPHGRTV